MLLKPFNEIPHSLTISNEDEKEIKFQIYPDSPFANFQIFNQLTPQNIKMSSMFNKPREKSC